MIKTTARLRIERIELGRLCVTEYQRRYRVRLLHYLDLLEEYEGQYAGILHVTPSRVYPGMYVILDGHTRFCAYLMMGYTDALCIIEEKGETP